MQRSSTTPATFGNNSLTSAPLCPYFLNENGDCKIFPVFVRINFGNSNGGACPLYFANAGFGSNVSTCEGPPDINKKITRFAFAGKCGSFTVNGLLEPAKASAPNKFANPNIPNPFAKVPSIRRRLN